MSQIDYKDMLLAMFHDQKTNGITLISYDNDLQTIHSFDGSLAVQGNPHLQLEIKKPYIEVSVKFFGPNAFKEACKFIKKLP